MKKLLSLFTLVFAFAAYASAQGIVGTWMNYDDEDGKPKAHIKVYENDGMYYAKVIKILDPARQDATCDKCKGDRKGKKTLGMVIMSGMKKTGEGEYRGGKILKPTNGKEYKCKVFVKNGGNELKVMGGIGPIWKSQKWERVQ